MAGREPAADLPHLRYRSPVCAGLVGAGVRLPDPPADKLPGSLTDNPVGSYSEGSEGVLMARCRDCVFWVLLDSEKGYRRCFIRYEHMTRREAVRDHDCEHYQNHLDACAKLRESML